MDSPESVATIHALETSAEIIKVGELSALSTYLQAAHIGTTESWMEDPDPF